MKTLLYGNGLWIKQNKLFKYDTTGQKLNNAIEDIKYDISRYGGEFESNVTKWLHNMKLNDLGLYVYGLNKCNKEYFFKTIEKLINHKFGEEQLSFESEVHSILFGFINETNRGNISDKLFRYTYALIFAILTKSLFNDIDLKYENTKPKKIQLKHKYENIFTTNYISYFDKDQFIHGNIIKALGSDVELSSDNYIEIVTKNYHIVPGIIGHFSVKENILEIFKTGYDEMFKKISGTEVHVVGINALGDSHLIEKIAEKTNLIYYYYNDQDKNDALLIKRKMIDNDITFKIKPFTEWEKDSEEFVRDVLIRTQFSKNASSWPYRLIEKRKKMKNKFDILYAQYEAMWHYESLILCEEIEYGNVTDLNFVASAVAVMGIVERIKKLFQEINIEHLFSPDFRKIIEENVFPTVASRFAPNASDGIELTIEGLKKMGMFKPKETGEKNDIKIAQDIIRHIRNKLVHFNSRDYGAIHIGGNFGERQNHFGFKTSFDSREQFSVNKDLYYLIYRNLKVYIEKNMKIWSNEIVKKLNSNYVFKPLVDTEFLEIINDVSFHDWGKRSDLISYSSFIFITALKMQADCNGLLLSITKKIIQIMHFLNEHPSSSEGNLEGVENIVDKIFSWGKHERNFLLKVARADRIGYISEKIASWDNDEFIEYFPHVFEKSKKIINSLYNDKLTLHENIVAYVLSNNVEELSILDEKMGKIESELLNSNDADSAIIKIFS